MPLGLAAVVLLVALRDISFGSPNLDDIPMGYVALAVVLWAVGRTAWARRGKSKPPERPKPRRRALPPVPRGGVHP